MSPSIEKRLRALEDQERSSKTSFPVAGSLVKFVVTKSQNFSLTVPAGENTTLRVKFTPSKNLGQNNFISLAAETSGLKYLAKYYTNPQEGDGTVTITMAVEGSLLEELTAQIVIIASGTVSGTFTKVE